MSLASRNADAFRRVGQEIKVLRSQVGGSAEPWSYGALATASSTYKTKAMLAGSEKLKIAVLSDSTSDGYTGGLPGGSTKWGNVWPNRLAKLLREQIGLPKGGENWIPAKTPTPPPGYSYNTASYGPPANATKFDDMNFQIGMPGSLWLQQGHATNAYEVTYTLTPGTTSVQVVLNGYAGRLLINNVSYDSVGVPKNITIFAPGSTLKIVGETGIGFGLLGIREYVGDEVVGVEIMNMAQAAISAVEVLGWLQNQDRQMKGQLQVFSPDVVLICLGSNDLGAGATPEAAVNALGGIALQIQSVVPDVEIVFLLRPHPTQGGAWDDFCARVIGGAASINSRVFDMRNGVFPPVTDTSVWLSDQMHLKAEGDVAFAAAVANYMKVKKPGNGVTESRVEEMMNTKFQVVSSFPQASAMTPGVIYLRT